MNLLKFNAAFLILTISSLTFAGSTAQNTDETQKKPPTAAECSAAQAINLKLFMPKNGYSDYQILIQLNQGAVDLGLAEEPSIDLKTIEAGKENQTKAEAKIRQKYEKIYTDDENRKLVALNRVRSAARMKTLEPADLDWEPTSVNEMNAAMHATLSQLEGQKQALDVTLVRCQQIEIQKMADKKNREMYQAMIQVQKAQEAAAKATQKKAPAGAQPTNAAAVASASAAGNNSSEAATGTN